MVRIFPIIKFKDSSHHTDQASRRYLATLASLIQYMPKPLALAKLPQIFPILLIALSLDDASLRSSVIETIIVLTLTEDSIAQTIQQHMSSLVSSLLNFSTSVSQNPPVSLALSC